MVILSQVILLRNQNKVTFFPVLVCKLVSGSPGSLWALLTNYYILSAINRRYVNNLTGTPIAFKTDDYRRKSWSTKLYKHYYFLEE